MPRLLSSSRRSSQTLASAQTPLEIFRKSLYRRLNWPRRRVTQRAERFALDVVAEIQQQFRIFWSSATDFNALENFHQPISAFATWRAPAARFMFIKLRQVLRRFKNIHGLVHHDEAARAHHRTARDQSFVIHAHVLVDDLVGAHDVNRRASGDDRL